MEAVGIIEIRGFVAALAALDEMVKTSQVEFFTWEKKLGGWLVTVIVKGSVGDVQEAIERGKSTAINEVAATAVIPAPHEEIRKLIELSSCKYK